MASVRKDTTLASIVQTIAFIRLLVPRSRLNAIDAAKLEFEHDRKIAQVAT